LLPLSNVAITLKQSNSFVKLAGLLHAFAAYLMYQSSFSPAILTVMMLVGIVSMGRILRNPFPVPAYKSLSHHHDHWRLLGTFQQESRYEHVRIGFDAGLFMILILTDANACKKLVVFRDQLSTSQYRALNVLGTIRPKKSSRHEKN
jgi:hypothetical protein